jgi:hypothetical protein
MTRNFSTALCPAVAALMSFVAAARAAECPRKDALGTSRVLAVDAAIYPRVGPKSFPQTLPLDDREVVLDLRRRTVAANRSEDTGGAGA